MTGQLVSAPVAQVLAGVAKIFVGEIVEKGNLSSIMTSIYLFDALKIQPGRFKSDKEKKVLLHLNIYGKRTAHIRKSMDVPRTGVKCGASQGADVCDSWTGVVTRMIRAKHRLENQR